MASLWCQIGLFCLLESNSCFSCLLEPNFGFFEPNCWAFCVSSNQGLGLLEPNFDFSGPNFAFFLTFFLSLMSFRTNFGLFGGVFLSFGAKFWAFRGLGNQMGLLCLSEQILDFFGLLEQKTVFSSLFLWVPNFGVFAKIVCFVYFSLTHLVFCGA